MRKIRLIQKSPALSVFMIIVGPDERRMDGETIPGTRRAVQTMPPIQSSALSENQFMYLLEHECKRARRYQFYFSLLVLKSEKPNAVQLSRTDIPDLVRRVIRNGDIIGVAQYNKLAILLYFADNPDKIAKRVVSNLHREIPGIKIKAGEVCFPVNGTTSEDLFRESLQRLL